MGGALIFNTHSYFEGFNLHCGFSMKVTKDGKMAEQKTAEQARTDMTRRAARYLPRRE